MILDELLGDLLCGATRLLAGTAVRWIGCEPSLQQRIYYANHSSHLDTLVIWSALPTEARRKLHPVAAHDFWAASSLRRYLAEEVFGAVLIRRPDHADTDEAPAEGSAHSAFEVMLAALGSDQSLLLFPEGTRGSGDTIAPLKSGLFHLAGACPGAEIIPVFLDNLNRILPKGEVMPVPFLSSARFGAALPPVAGLSKSEYLDLAREALNQLGEDES